MTVDEPVTRVLLLTSGPLDGRRGADIQLAAALARSLQGLHYYWFRQWPPRPRSAFELPGRAVPVLSSTGVPGRPERFQAAAVGALLAHRVELVHAVMTIGESFPGFSRMWPRLIGNRPVLHTVPGVMDPQLLADCRPLGPTVAHSEAAARNLHEAGFGEVCVVGPPVPLDRWPMMPRRIDGPPVVLVTGHHDPGGGAQDAIAASGVAVRAGARLRLVLAVRDRPGQNPARRVEELRAQAAHEGLRDTEVLGHVEDMGALLAAADILLYLPTVLGAKADIPLTVLEALATGRPVILSELPQFVALHDTVLRAPLNDPHRTGHLLRQLLERPWWWQHLAEQGRAVVESRFGEDRFVARYARLYRELLQ
ncbi:glycosyltransferase family 4 protein [Streptomyces sp. NA04227]|uniref:glycosyltransferase n=1 Tax=Streptomyces sp. NA04227 TaxID=2742136 RepID=UPI001590335A|nr:glycosyltransferase [Streptomyces sp. NA04227]QKW09738.1 glycosyltransferase family 4 protein [Streptomyces sp. NA04227]